MPEWPPQVRPIGAVDLPKVLQGSILVGLHCWARWNAYDYEFAKEIQKLLDAFPGWLVIYTFDVEVESNQAVLIDWNINNVPSFVVYFQGELQERLVYRNETVRMFCARVHSWLEAFIADQASRVSP